MKSQPNFILIGQKIPSSVKPYNKLQIAAKEFAGKHSSLLRILTKWAEYLENILKKPEAFIQNRNYPLKNIKGETVLLQNEYSKERLIYQLKT